MTRLSSPLCLLLITAACQTTVNLTEGSATNTDGGTGDSTTDPKTTGDCADGTEGCPCYGNGTCNESLVCNADNVCEPPPGSTTGGTTSETSGKTTGNTTDTTGNTGNTSNTTGDTSNTTDTTGDTSNGSTDGTTGGGDPGCGAVPADMACVPAATFEMGTSLDTFLGQQVGTNEQPGHMVTISTAFWIDKTEVTVEDYAMCWALKVCDLPMQGPNLNWGIAGKEKHPANGINWHQAKKYCEWKGKRLPTEAEWELAARGTDGRLFPWGNDSATCDHLVSDVCGTSGTQPVGSKPLGASPYGLHDMGGNVFEWCSDYYKEDYYYDSPEVDPQGPADGTKRTLRSLAVYIYTPGPGSRATLRTGGSPLGNDSNPAILGFRCAQTPP